MSDDVLFVGHSLVGQTMPRMLDGLLAASQTVHAQIINGSPLWYNWENGARAEGVNARAALRTGAYGSLILTEAVPLLGHLQWSDTYGAASKYAALAWANNRDTRVLIYETWGEIGTDTAQWRASLTSDQPLWQGIADHVSAGRPTGAPQAGIVPGGQAMGLIHDAITTGRGLGLTEIRQLFTDQIHLNDSGNYLIALVQAATLTGRSPIGLTDQLTGEWGQPFGGWSADQTVLFQHIAWESAAAAPGAVLTSGAALPQLLTGDAASETLTAGDGDDRIYGNRGNDRLNGLAGHDLLSGELGKDRLFGGAGHDRLFGGGGADRLHGGPAKDVLTGGAGADAFVFARGGGADRITDFSALQSDHLVLDDALWTGPRTAAQVVTSFARVTPDGVLFTFGPADSLLLQGLTTRHGLAALIEIL